VCRRRGEEKWLVTLGTSAFNLFVSHYALPRIKLLHSQYDNLARRKTQRHKSNTSEIGDEIKRKLQVGLLQRRGGGSLVD
jgi:hypothetical protein